MSSRRQVDAIDQDFLAVEGEFESLVHEVRSDVQFIECDVEELSLPRRRDLGEDDDWPPSPVLIVGQSSDG